MKALARLPATMPRVRLVDFEMAAVDIFHEGLLMAPVTAIPRLLARHGLNVRRHRAVGNSRGVLGAGALPHQGACRIRTSSAPRPASSTHSAAFRVERMNPNGGSVALGHPFAATGARILSQAVKELAAMAPGSRAIVSICADGGLGTVALLEC